MKAAWEMMEIFYADKQSQAWLPERVVDWLAVMISLILLGDVLNSFPNEFLKAGQVLYLS